MKKALQQFLVTVLSILVGLAVMAGIGLLIWYKGMMKVPPNAARAWALLATVALPLTAVIFWWFGKVEARGRLRGIDDAVDSLIGAIVGVNTRSRYDDRRNGSPNDWVLPNQGPAYREQRGGDRRTMDL